MTTAVRYKLVTNTTGAALTAAGVQSSDGNDRMYRVIQRIFSAADIGNGAGQTQNAGGCIIDVLPAGTNVLAIEGSGYKMGGTGARRLDNLVTANAAQIANLQYWVDANNNVRVVDAGGNAATQLAANDIVIVKLTIGVPPTPNA